MKLKKGFASDNWSGVCPEIMETLSKVNPGHNEAYGELEDPYTISAIEKFKKYFGEDIAVFFVYNGTAANVLSISQMMRSYHAVVTVGTAHLNEDGLRADGVTRVRVNMSVGSIKYRGRIAVLGTVKEVNGQNAGSS